MSTEHDSYRLVTADYGGELEDAVNTLIREGYEPLGGVSISVMQIDAGTSIIQYAQAMYRRPAGKVVKTNFEMKLKGDPSDIANRIAALDLKPPRHA